MTALGVMLELDLPTWGQAFALIIFVAGGFFGVFMALVQIAEVLEGIRRELEKRK